MSAIDDPGGGGGVSVDDSNQSSIGILPVTSVWAKGRNYSSGGASLKMRTFEEIIADAKSNRNILEIHLKKKIPTDDPSKKPTNLTYDQLGELLFDVLQIKTDDCLRLNFSTSRYDTREVVLKPSVDLLPYIKVIDDFYGHTVTTCKQSSNIVRVSFRNVPANVPDEEILHLCNFYGKPLNNVEYDRMTNLKCAGLSGSNRFVDIEMFPGKRFLDYY